VAPAQEQTTFGDVLILARGHHFPVIMMVESRAATVASAMQVTHHDGCVVLV
jgi:hypothetical protein